MLSRFTACALIGGQQLTNTPYREFMLADVRRSPTCVAVARWWRAGTGSGVVGSLAKIAGTADGGSR